MSPDMVTLTLIVFGGAGMLGSISFSKFYMANRRRFIFVTTAAPTLCLLLLLAEANLIVDKEFTADDEEQHDADHASVCGLGRYGNGFQHRFPGQYNKVCA